MTYYILTQNGEPVLDSIRGQPLALQLYRSRSDAEDAAVRRWPDSRIGADGTVTVNGFVAGRIKPVRLLFGGEP